jgi:hypothetical protein
MTFTTTDQSVDAGAPIELFEFTEGARAWRFTTRSVPVTHGGATYLPAAITRGSIIRDAGSLGDPLQITLPDTNPLALEMLAGLVMHQTAVRVLRLHLSDPDMGARVLFQGVTTGVSFQGASATVSCGSQYALASRRQIASTSFQAGCNLTWGSSRCGVNREVYRVDTTAVASDQVGRTLTLPALISPAAHFNGGRVRLGSAERFIEKHAAGGVLTLNYPFGGLTSSAQALAVYPDCKKTEADCASRYNNLPNYLGWSRLPSINPYNRSAYYLEEAVTVAPPAGSTGDIPSGGGSGGGGGGGGGALDGYQVRLLPSALEYTRTNQHDDGFRVVFTFTMEGYLLVRWDFMSADPNASFVRGSVETSLPGMWADPRPLPAWGDLDFRVDLAYPQGVTEYSATQVASWMTPPTTTSCSARAGNWANSIYDFTQTLIATVRVRNHTSGVVIAQGDITITLKTIVPPQEQA